MKIFEKYSEFSGKNTEILKNMVNFLEKILKIF